MAARISVTLDPAAWLAELQTDLDAALADLIQICSASENKNYAETVSEHRVGIARILLENPEALGETAPERAARACFLGGIGKFISFLDKLIANQRIVRNGITITRALNGEDEIRSYVNECLDRQIKEVASDRSLTNPRKLGCFQVAELVKTTALAYFELRRALEHHQDAPQQDFSFPMMRIGFFVDDSEILELPAECGPGQTINMRTITDRRNCPAGRRIILTPEDAHALLFTLRNILAPELFRACVESV
jgi:hypothetical protein